MEFEAFLQGLGAANPGDLSFLDLACGTGATTVYAAKHFKEVIAVDISEAMLDQAKKKAAREGLSNVVFHQAGFLSYNHRTEPVDVLYTKAALHHLPDFWKQAALLNMNRMVKLGGILYLFDVVFQFNPEEARPKVNGFIEGYEKAAGPAFRKEVEIHIRDEFSTYGWIMEGMLARAGFQIDKSTSQQDGFLWECYCRKVMEKDCL